jgi:hypothetical protein
MTQYLVYQNNTNKDTTANNYAKIELVGSAAKSFCSRSEAVGICKRPSVFTRAVSGTWFFI